MAKIAVTTTVTEEVKIEPTLKRKLMTELRAYETQKKILDAAQEKMDKSKAKIQAIREETGEMALDLEGGYGTRLVAPTRKTFDEKTFVANGGDLAIYNNSIIEVPVKPYEKITVPKVVKGGK